MRRLFCLLLHFMAGTTLLEAQDCSTTIMKSYVLEEPNKVFGNYNGRVSESTIKERGYVLLYRSYSVQGDERCMEMLFFVIDPLCKPYKSLRDMLKFEMLSYSTNNDFLSLPSQYLNDKWLITSSNRFDSFKLKLKAFVDTFVKIAPCEFIQIFEADILFDVYQGGFTEFLAFNPLTSKKRFKNNVFFREVLSITNIKKARFFFAGPQKDRSIQPYNCVFTDFR